MKKGQIHKGVTVAWRDPDTGERLVGRVHAHLVADYWQCIMLNGCHEGHLRDVKESSIISIQEPVKPGKKTREVQGELF